MRLRKTGECGQLNLAFTRLPVLHKELKGKEAPWKKCATATLKEVMGCEQKRALHQGSGVLIP